VDNQKKKVQEFSKSKLKLPDLKKKQRKDSFLWKKLFKVQEIFPNLANFLLSFSYFILDTLLNISVLGQVELE